MITTLLVFGVIGLMTFIFLLSLCVSASDADDRIDEMLSKTKKEETK